MLAATVKGRRRELAIRQAIGAAPARLRRMVVVQGIWLCGAGLAFGLTSGLASGRLLRTVLYGVAPNDLYTVSGVIVLVMITSVAASYVPARLATRLDVAALLPGCVSGVDAALALPRTIALRAPPRPDRSMKLTDRGGVHER